MLTALVPCLWNWLILQPCILPQYLHVNRAQCEPHTAKRGLFCAEPFIRYWYRAKHELLKYSVVVHHHPTASQEKYEVVFHCYLQMLKEVGEWCNGKWQLHWAGSALRSNVWPFIQMTNLHVLQQIWIDKFTQAVDVQLRLRTHVPSSCCPTWQLSLQAAFLLFLAFTA